MLQQMSNESKSNDYLTSISRFMTPGLPTLVPSVPKGNSKCKIFLVKIFSPK